MEFASLFLARYLFASNRACHLAHRIFVLRIVPPLFFHHFRFKLARIVAGKTRRFVSGVNCYRQEYHRSRRVVLVKATSLECKRLNRFSSNYHLRNATRA